MIVPFYVPPLYEQGRLKTNHMHPKLPSACFTATPISDAHTRATINHRTNSYYIYSGSWHQTEAAVIITRLKYNGN